MGNEAYEITISSPLLRPGLTIKTSVSQRYLVKTTRELLDLVREINMPKEDLVYKEAIELLTASEEDLEKRKEEEAFEEEAVMLFKDGRGGTGNG